jgi:hypothetical protein
VGEVRLFAGEALVERPSIIAKEVVIAELAKTSRWLRRLIVACCVVGWGLLAWSIAS